jgi:hypothetical protein
MKDIFFGLGAAEAQSDSRLLFFLSDGDRGDDHNKKHPGAGGDAHARSFLQQ